MSAFDLNPSVLLFRNSVHFLHRFYQIAVLAENNRNVIRLASCISY